MSVRGLHVACSVSLCLAAASRVACGQETGSARWRIVGAWLALGPNASFLTRMGSRHHDVYVLGVRVERPLARSGGVELYHTVDAVPLAVSTATPLEYDERSCHSRPAPSDTIVPLCARQVARMGSVYGFGLSPAGLELRYVPHYRGVQVVAGAAVGALFFTAANANYANSHCQHRRRRRCSARRGGRTRIRGALPVSTHFQCRLGARQPRRQCSYAAGRARGAMRQRRAASVSFPSFPRTPWPPLPARG